MDPEPTPTGKWIRFRHLREKGSGSDPSGKSVYRSDIQGKMNLVPILTGKWIRIIPLQKNRSGFDPYGKKVPDPTLTGKWIRFYPYRKIDPYLTLPVYRSYPQRKNRIRILPLRENGSGSGGKTGSGSDLLPAGPTLDATRLAFLLHKFQTKPW